MITSYLPTKVPGWKVFRVVDAVGTYYQLICKGKVASPRLKRRPSDKCIRDCAVGWEQTKSDLSLEEVAQLNEISRRIQAGDNL